MTSLYVQHFGTRVCLLVVALTVAVTAQATPPPNPFQSVYDLYRANKPTEARQLLIKMTDERIAYSDGIDLKKDGSEVWKAKEMMGFCGGLRTITGCLGLELQHGDGKISVDMVQLSTRAIQAMDRYARKAKEVAPDDPRIQQEEAFGRTYQAELITKVVGALRATGEPSRADEFIKQHQTIIKERGIQVDDAHTATQSPRGTPASVEVDGRTLATMLLIIRYYDALSQKDAKTLQGCLTVDSKPAAAILAEADHEAKAKGDFDALDSVTVDAKTTLRIAADSAAPTEFKVAIDNVVKTFRKDGQAFVRRESDQLRFRIVDGEYKIVMTAK